MIHLVTIKFFAMLLLKFKEDGELYTIAQYIATLLEFLVSQAANVSQQK